MSRTMEELSGVESMASAREIPWHRIGTVVPEALTAKAMLKASGCDWRVEKEEMFLADGTPVPGYVGLVRQTDRKTLGVATPRYEVVQNQELYEFAEGLVEAGLLYETGGSLRGGKEVWCLARLPEGLLIAGEDPIERYLLARTSHGGGAMRVMPTKVRVWCQNTIELAERSARFLYKVHHWTGVQGRLQAAREALQLSFKHDDLFVNEATKLVSKRVSHQKFEQILEQLFDPGEDPSPRAMTVAEGKIEKVVAFWKADKFSETGWGAVNAVNEFEQWSKDKAETQARLIIDGMPLTSKVLNMVRAR